MKRKALSNIRDEITQYIWTLKSTIRSEGNTEYKFRELNTALRTIQGYITAFYDIELITYEDYTQFQYVVRTLWQECCQQVKDN